MLNLSSFLALCKDYSLIPLKYKIGEFEAFPCNILEFNSKKPYRLLLESGEYEKETGQFTYYAQDPFISMQLKDDYLYVNGICSDIASLNPVQYLNSFLRQYRSPIISDLPPFTGGAIGFFSYDFIKQFENIKISNQKPSGFSEFHLAWIKEVLVYDHAKKELSLIYNAEVNPSDTLEEKKRKYWQAKKYLINKGKYLIEKVKKNLNKEMMAKKSEVRNQDVKKDELDLNFSSYDFIDRVNQIKEEILKGEVFQTVLSERFKIPTEKSPENIYKILREINPSPYMFYLKMKDESLIGTSPETLVKVENNLVSTFPIAGTRPRGKTKEEDYQLEVELLHDPKEIAEHVMLIDLARNDLGKVSQPGSVKLEKKLKVEKYSHVMHLVSKVTGVLKEGYNAIDVLQAVFPAGTVSGAPKIKAMDLIAELEPNRRGPYAGAIAALSFNGNLDTCITIRSIFFKDKTAYIQAGAGIVNDSIPEKEYLEVLNKAKAMLKAIQTAKD